MIMPRLLNLASLYKRIGAGAGVWAGMVDNRIEILEFVKALDKVSTHTLSG
jgi:hypothetical protein